MIKRLTIVERFFAWLRKWNGLPNGCQQCGQDISWIPVWYHHGCFCSHYCCRRHFLDQQPRLDRKIHAMYYRGQRKMMREFIARQRKEREVLRDPRDE